MSNMPKPDKRNRGYGFVLSTAAIVQSGRLPMGLRPQDLNHIYSEKEEMDLSDLLPDDLITWNTEKGVKKGGRNG